MVKPHVNSKLSNFSLLNDHVENLIEKISASVYWKDKKGVYLGTNSLFLKVSAMQTIKEIAKKLELSPKTVEHYLERINR